MIRRSITFLMIALVAMQSVVAVADAHRLHQSGSEHLTFEHMHERGEGKSRDDGGVSSVEQAGLGDFDCHHCCHCHGMANFFTGNSHDSFVAIPIGNEAIDYQASYVSYRASPDNPPPIG